MESPSLCRLIIASLCFDACREEEALCGCFWVDDVRCSETLSRRSAPPGSYLRQPGHCVVNAGKALGSGAGSAFQKLLSLFWMLVAAPG